MASLPPSGFTPLSETAEYETGVYQIAPTDDVIGGDGGISNFQAQGLANRTAWLKQQLAAEVSRAESAESAETQRAESIEATLAPLVSPAFSGDPHAPTPGAGDATPSIANTFWVSQYYLALVGGTLNGALVVNGGVTVQGGASLNLTGSGQLNSTGAVCQGGPAGSGWSGNVSTGYNPIFSQLTGVYLSQAVYSFNKSAAAGYFGTGAAGGHIFEYYNSKGGLIGYIANNGDTSVSYSQTSDYRLKENVAPLIGAAAVALIERLRPVEFDWIGQPDSRTHGFIAHELGDVVPSAVTGAKDATRTVVTGVIEDEHQYGPLGLRTEERILPQGVDHTRLIPDLVAAVAYLSARVRELEARQG